MNYKNETELRAPEIDYFICSSYPKKQTAHIPNARKYDKNVIK